MTLVCVSGKVIRNRFMTSDISWRIGHRNTLEDYFGCVAESLTVKVVHGVADRELGKIILDLFFKIRSILGESLGSPEYHSRTTGDNRFERRSITIPVYRVGEILVEETTEINKENIIRVEGYQIKGVSRSCFERDISEGPFRLMLGYGLVGDAIGVNGHLDNIGDAGGGHVRESFSGGNSRFDFFGNVLLLGVEDSHLSVIEEFALPGGLSVQNLDKRFRSVSSYRRLMLLRRKLTGRVEPGLGVLRSMSRAGSSRVEMTLMIG